MWILTEEGNSINLDRAYKIYMKPAPQNKIRVCVAINFNAGTLCSMTLGILDSEDDAKTFIKDLTKAVNGEKKDALSYSFSWLKNSDAVSANLKPAIEKDKNETLIDSVDGVPF